VGASERVDAVVVGAVGEGGEFVEEVVQVRAGHDLDESVLAAAATGWARTYLDPVARRLLARK
jgi:hypothetical protein